MSYESYRVLEGSYGVGLRRAYKNPLVADRATASDMYSHLSSYVTAVILLRDRPSFINLRPPTISLKL